MSSGRPEMDSGSGPVAPGSFPSPTQPVATVPSDAKWRPRRSIAFRTAVGAVGLVFVVLAALVASTYALASRTVNQQLDESVRQAWQRASMAVAGPGSDSSEFGLLRPDPVAAPGLPAGTVVALISPEGYTVAGTVGFEDGQALTDADLEQMRSQAQNLESGRVVRAKLAGEDYALVAKALPWMPGAQVTGQVLVVGLPAQAYDATNRQLLWVLLAGSVVALVLVGAGVWWWIARSLNPLERVAVAARDVSSAPLSSGTLDLSGNRLPDELSGRFDEVGDVALALNELIDSVADALDARAKSEDQLRKFVADASHELRTPLAAVQGYADMIRLTESLSPNATMLLDRVLGQSGRMSELVETMLSLARLDASEAASSSGVPGGGAEPQVFTEVDLGEIVFEAATDAALTSPGHLWETSIPDEPVMVRASRSQMNHLVQNLLSNAQKHTPPGTQVRTVLRLEGPGAILTVSDNGPGIPPELGQTVFDRFIRGDSARASAQGSTGLGLSIVQSVARAHGGSARVESGDGDGSGSTSGDGSGNTPDGGWTTFVVTLPLARPAEHWRGPQS